MVPSDDQIRRLWKQYQFPPEKRTHVLFVDKIALFLAKKIEEKTHVIIDETLLHAAALLHDIDKSVGGKHPESAVAILKNEGMDEVAGVVATHSLHTILNPNTAPKTWEQKLLYLGDKMVKYDIVGVDKRFALWNDEHLPPQEQKILDESYPKVKKLEQEVFKLAGTALGDILTMKEGIV